MRRGPPLHSPVYSRREPTARERAKLADEKVAACKAAKEDFDASLKQLRFKLLGAKGQVEAKARDEAQRAAFAKLADLILEGHWSSARLSAARGSMTKIFADAADTVIFDPANWADIIDDPMAIPRGLENCRQAYRSLRDLYEALSPEEQKTLFPDGLPEHERSAHRSRRRRSPARAREVMGNGAKD